METLKLENVHPGQVLYDKRLKRWRTVENLKGHKIKFKGQKLEVNFNPERFSLIEE